MRDAPGLPSPMGSQHWRALSFMQDKVQGGKSSDLAELLAPYACGSRALLLVPFASEP